MSLNFNLPIFDLHSGNNLKDNSHVGRIMQKDLRSKLTLRTKKLHTCQPFEKKELIEKFKRGRGNITILKDEKDQLLGSHFEDAITFLRNFPSQIVKNALFHFLLPRRYYLPKRKQH